MAHTNQPPMQAVVDGFLGRESRLSMLVIHVNLLAYSLAFWLCQPGMAALCKSVGGDDVAYGTLQSTTALLGLMGTPVLGRVVDARGARFALLLCVRSLVFYVFKLTRSNENSNLGPHWDTCSRPMPLRLQS